MSVDILNKTRKSEPKINFNQIKNKVLGKKYTLSLVFCGDFLAKNLNKKHRNKNYTPEILTFALEENFGEIFINLKKAEQEREQFKMGKNEFIAYLFIHGLLHLKGFCHGVKMNSKETKFLKYAKDNNFYSER